MGRQMESRKPWDPLGGRSVAKRVCLNCFCITVIALFTGCAGKAPIGRPDQEVKKTETFARESFLKLENQSSFKFRLKFERKGGLVDVEGSFEGSYLFPHMSSINGYWSFAGNKEELTVIMSGDQQFRFDSEARTWVEEAASKEINPLLQLERTVALGNFEYIGKDRIGGRQARRFSFEPNLAFLDPRMEKDLEGWVWVNDKTGLPVKVRIDSKDKKIFWNMSLFDFNSPLSIEVPVRHVYEATFVAREGKNAGMTLTGSLLGARLSWIGLKDVRVESRTSQKLKIGFESFGDRTEIIRLVSRPGSLSVRLARWPEGPVYKLSDEVVKNTYGQDADLGFERGNMTKPLVLLDVLLANDDLKGASFEYDEFSRPVVDVEITTEAAERLEEATEGHVGNPMAFLVDGKVVSAPVVRIASCGNLVRIGGLSSIKEAKSIWGMLATGPLPVDLALKSIVERGQKTSIR